MGGGGGGMPGGEGGGCNTYKEFTKSTMCLVAITKSMMPHHFHPYVYPTPINNDPFNRRGSLCNSSE